MTGELAPCALSEGDVGLSSDSDRGLHRAYYGRSPSVLIGTIGLAIADVAVVLEQLFFPGRQRLCATGKFLLNCCESHLAEKIRCPREAAIDEFLVEANSLE